MIMMNSIISNIVNIWDGLAIPFPIIRGMEEGTYLYCAEKHNTKIHQARAVIITYEFNDSWDTTLDVMLPEEQVRDMFIAEDLFVAPVVIAIGYQDRQAWINVSTVYLNKDTLFQQDHAFLQKEWFKLLIKDE